MLEDLPTLIDPKHLAFQGYHLKGSVALEQMSRMTDVLCEVAGNVVIDWLFTTDEQQRPIIQGYIQTQLSLQCQRCLQPMLWPIHAKVALMVLKEGQTEDDLPLGYETLTLTNTPISLPTLIEDELILALPIVVKHMVCSSNEYQLNKSQLEKSRLKNNPFQILSGLTTHHSS